jgi:hypothetical protein
MSIKLRTSVGWKNLDSLKLKTSGGWKNVAQAFLRTSGGWKIIFGIYKAGPQINAAPEINAGSWSVVSSVGRFVLTGTNKTWSYNAGGTISQSYQFEKSTDGNSWTSLGSSGSITNGQTKTLTIFQSDYTTDTQYYRFTVTATANVDNSINAESSTSVVVTIPYPTALTNGYVQAISSGTGSLNPSVGSYSSSGGVGSFTLNWSSLTNVSSLVVSWLLESGGNTLNYTTSPSSPQTYTTANTVNGETAFTTTLLDTNVKSLTLANGAITQTLGTTSLYNLTVANNVNLNGFNLNIGNNN